MMPGYVILSYGCTPDRCSFSTLDEPQSQISTGQDHVRTNRLGYEHLSVLYLGAVRNPLKD